MAGEDIVGLGLGPTQEIGVLLRSGRVLYLTRDGARILVEFELVDAGGFTIVDGAFGSKYAQ